MKDGVKAFAVLWWAWILRLTFTWIGRQLEKVEPRRKQMPKIEYGK